MQTWPVTGTDEQSTFPAVMACAGQGSLLCRALAILVCCLVLTLATPQQSAAWSETDPRSCLANMMQAVETRDTSLFERQADIEGLTRQVFAELEHMAGDEQRARWLPPLVTLLASQGALTSSLTSGFLVSEVRAFVLYGVGSGAFAGQKVPGYTSESMLSPLFDMVSMGRKEIRDMGVPVRVDRDRMRLPFAVHDHDNGNTYRVVGIFTVTSGGCRLTSLENVRDLIIQLGLESSDQMVQLSR